METRCPDYRCEAASVDGLVQQVAVSYLRHGYFYYVADVLKPHVDPYRIDELILSKYNIRKCWRYRAEQKARGWANLQYIRHRHFYVIMATEGPHPFKDREKKKLRDVRETPIFVPLSEGPLWSGSRKKKRYRDQPSIVEGYSVGYMRGRYERKTADERAAYRKAWDDWKQNRLRGIRVPKPPKGKVKIKWHPTVAIEDASFDRLHAFFMTYATKWKRSKLEVEFRSVPYRPYWAVKRQLFDILCDVNEARKKAGLDELPFRVVHGLKRDQIFPFGHETNTAKAA